MLRPKGRRGGERNLLWLKPHGDIMALQLQAVGVPQNDALTEWSARLLVTRDGIPLNGLSEDDFSFLFPWKDGRDDSNQFNIDPNPLSFSAQGFPGGPHGLDGVYEIGLLAPGGFFPAGHYFCKVTVKYSKRVPVGPAVGPGPHPRFEFDTEQAEAMLSFFAR
jgi:hypothetical protein